MTTEIHRFLANDCNMAFMATPHQTNPPFSPKASARVTAVMFSRNRPELLRESIHRYCEQGLPLVVCDGSLTPLSRNQIRLAEYIHRPGVPLWKRISEGLGRVVTPFAVLAADDDEILTPALESCAQFLDEQKDAVRVGGTTTLVERSHSDFRRAIADLQVERTLELQNPADALERFLEMCDRSPQVFYSVIRTPLAQSIARVLATIPDGAGLLAEQLWTVLPSLSGGTHLLDKPLAVRTFGQEPPNYGMWRACFSRATDISDWEGWTELSRSLRQLNDKLNVTPAQMDAVLERLRHDNWVFPSTSGSRPSSMWLSAWRALLCAKYISQPRALFRHGDRFIFNGIRNNRMARCRSYPWNCAQSFASVRLPKD